MADCSFTTLGRGVMCARPISSSRALLWACTRKPIHRKRLVAGVLTIHRAIDRYTPKGSTVTDPNLKATINDNALSTVHKLTYRGVTYTRNVKWTNRVEGIFRKCVRQRNFEGCQRLLRILSNLPRRALYL